MHLKSLQPSESLQILDIWPACDAALMHGLCCHLLQYVRNGSTYNLLSSGGGFDNSKMVMLKGMVSSCNQISRGALPEAVRRRVVSSSVRTSDREEKLAQMQQAEAHIAAAKLKHHRDHPDIVMSSRQSAGGKIALGSCLSR